MGNVPLLWKTVNFTPIPTNKFINKIENLNIIQKMPFGTYAGIVVTLNPRYRLTPLSLKHQSKIKNRSATETSYVGLKE